MTMTYERVSIHLSTTKHRFKIETVETKHLEFQGNLLIYLLTYLLTTGSTAMNNSHSTSHCNVSSIHTLCSIKLSNYLHCVCCSKIKWLFSGNIWTNWLHASQLVVSYVLDKLVNFWRWKIYYHEPQNSARCPSPELDESSTHPHILFSDVHFNNTFLPLTMWGHTVA